MQQFGDDSRSQEWLQYHPFGADAPPEATYFRLQALARNPPAEESTSPGEPPEINQGVRELRKTALDSFAMPQGGFEYMTFCPTLERPAGPPSGLNLDGQVPSHMRGTQPAQPRPRVAVSLPANHPNSSAVPSAPSRAAPPIAHPPSIPPTPPNMPYPPPSGSASALNQRVDAHDKDHIKSTSNGIGSAAVKVEFSSSSNPREPEKRINGIEKEAAPSSPRFVFMHPGNRSKSKYSLVPPGIRHRQRRIRDTACRHGAWCFKLYV